MSECITTANFMAFFCPAFSSVGCHSNGVVEFVDVGAAGDSILIGSLVAVAVAEEREAGSLTWTVGETAAESAASFAAMILDSLLAELVTATTLIDVVTLTTIATGYASLLSLSIVAADDPDAYALTAFAGGVMMVETILAAVCRLVGNCFGSQRELAQYYLAAHMLAGTKGQDMGTQTSAAINAISAGFAATPFGGADAVYANTQYGRQFLLIRSLVPRFGFSVITSGGCCGC